MPESADPDRKRGVEETLDRILRAASRLEAENRGLRERLAEARERARRLRDRLAHVEDQV